jgi:hypothetical protein
MNAAELITAFLERVADDPSMGPSHIALYVAIAVTVERQVAGGAVTIRRRVVMRQAKLRCEMTYHKCMRDLQAAGYLRYIPSYDPRVGTQVILLGDREKVESEWRGDYIRRR